METKTPKLNVRLLRRIQKAILKEPSQFQMPVTFSDCSSTGRKPANCGTAACIAGWAVALQRKDENLAKAHAASYGTEGTLYQAARLLGIPRWDADELFISDFWPQPFRSRYTRAKTDLAAARAAVDRIEHLIKTGVR